MYAALISLEGVLKNDRDAPIGEGRMLLEALRLAGVRVTMLTDGTDAQATHWTKVNKVAVDAIIANDVRIDPAETLRHRQIQVARSLGLVSMVIDADPEVVAWALSEGLTGVLVAHPAYMLPKARPEGVRRPWTAILDELDRQAGTIPQISDDDGEGDVYPLGEG